MKLDKIERNKISVASFDLKPICIIAANNLDSIFDAAK